MKAFFVVLFCLFSTFFVNSTPQPDWLIYINADGSFEVYNDGCDKALTVVTSSGGVFNYGGPC